MDALNDILDMAAEWLFGGVILPLLMAVARFISLCFTPISSFSPVFQISVAAVLGAFLSMGLSRRFKGQNAKASEARFKERLEAKKSAGDIDDEALRKAVSKGLDREADEAYEHLMLDKFFELGITYLFPMFFFLLWIEYHAFTPEVLQGITGADGLILSGIDTPIGAGTLYLYLFNLILITVALGRWLIRRFVLKKR